MGPGLSRSAVAVVEPAVDIRGRRRARDEHAVDASAVEFEHLEAPTRAVHVLTALQASVWVSVVGFAVAAIASLLLPSRSKVQAHLEEARRLAEADVEPEAPELTPVA